MKVKSLYKIDSVAEDNWNYKVGHNCESIEYHEPQGDGDAHYCDVKFSDGRNTRVFRPDEVEFQEEPTHE